MYLSAEKWISGYDHNKDKNFGKVLDLMNLNREDVENSATVSVNVGYWRKANAIHNWFVQNVQGGEDNRSRHFVSREKLKELQSECKAALDAFNNGDKDAAAEILPPTSGFFFGSTEIDEWYKQDLENTIKIIDRVLGPKFKNWDFTYRASW